VRQLIQQAQETLRQPVDNHAAAVRQILLMWHGWMRDLDEQVYFWPIPGRWSSERSMEGLIEFDPANLTDSITVVQELDTPEERIVLDQMGQDKLAKGLITMRQYLEEYAREQDAVEVEKRIYAEKIKNHILGEMPLQPGLLLAVAQAAMGEIELILAAKSPNYAIALAQRMAQTSQAQPQMPGQGEGGSIAQSAGVRMPGIGMATTLEGQTGQNVPGGQAPPVPAGA